MFMQRGHGVSTETLGSQCCSHELAPFLHKAAIETHQPDKNRLDCDPTAAHGGVYRAQQEFTSRLDPHQLVFVFYEFT